MSAARSTGVDTKTSNDSSSSKTGAGTRAGTRTDKRARTTWTRRRLGALVVTTALLGAAACSGTDAADRPTAPADQASWLFVLRADTATVDKVDDRYRVTLIDLDPSTTAFTDRPNRQATTEETVQFGQRWSERFDDDPPNAVLTAVRADDGDETAVVTIESFTLAEPTTALLEVTVLDEPGTATAFGHLATTDDPAQDLGTTLAGVHLFVDGATVGPDGSSTDPGDATGDATDATGMTGTTGTPDPTTPNSTTTTGAPVPGATPHLDAVEKKLMETNPTSKDIVWSRTTGNALLPRNGIADGWLLQTPQCWGKTMPAAADDTDPGGVCDGSAFTRFTGTLAEITADATTIVDLTTLYPFPDDLFRQALIDGLAQSYKKGNRPLIRMTAGVPPSYSINGATPKQWMEDLVAAISSESGVSADQIPMAIASVATSWGYSWNHSKIVAVDGQQATIGGHNFWTADYLQTDNPVSDVTLHHQGPVVAKAHDYIDNQWAFICANTGWSGILNVSYAATDAVGTCPKAHPALPAPQDPTPGNISMLSVGKLGIGISNKAVDGGPLPTDLASEDDAKAIKCSSLNFVTDYTNRYAQYERSNPGEPALRALIASAQRDITITQQDLIGLCSAKIVPMWDIRVFDALAERIANGVAVRVVVSTPGSWDYSNDGTLADVSSYLLSRVAKQVGGDAAKAKDLYCKTTAVASIRVDGDATWAGGKPIGNHTKVVAVDHAAFYVGSENLYPAWLQEYGVITEDAEAAKTFYTELLDPMWTHSEPTKDPSVCG